MKLEIGNLSLEEGLSAAVSDLAYRHSPRIWVWWRVSGKSFEPKKFDLRFGREAK